MAPRLWHRLKQHRLAQWSIGDVAVAYGIQHAVTLTVEAMEWPPRLATISRAIEVGR